MQVRAFPQKTTVTFEAAAWEEIAELKIKNERNSNSTRVLVKMSRPHAR